MQTSYDVRIWATRRYMGTHTVTFYVRWSVAGAARQKPFKNEALADGFRADLVAGSRKGEAFDVDSGLPMSMLRAVRDATSWYTLACEYVDMKWPHVAATTRRTHAEALTTMTTALFAGQRGKPDDKLIRKALCRYAFNTAHRDDPHRPAAIGEALRWVETHTRSVSALAEPEVLRTVLDAVAAQPRSGPRLVAFFACLYFAALRPEEASALAKPNLSLPSEGWGELHLEAAEPYAGKEWTDSAHNRDQRQLKQRAVGDTRTVPCPPDLTAIINAHVDQFGFGPDGKLFVGERNGAELPKLTIVRAWKRARAAVFTSQVFASPLVATPYDLRHAAVSGWLNAGVPVPDVAEWAGHSPEVLLKTYAKCIDGGTEELRRRVERFLGHDG